METELFLRGEHLFPGMNVVPFIVSEQGKDIIVQVKEGGRCVLLPGEIHLEPKDLDPELAKLIRFKPVDVFTPQGFPLNTIFVVFLGGEPAGEAFNTGRLHAFVGSGQDRSLWLGAKKAIEIEPSKLPPNTLLVPIATVAPNEA